MTDTQLLNWIESQGTPGMKWIARRSTTGRGFRLHQSPDREALAWGAHCCGDTLREAIEVAFNNEMAAAHERIKNARASELMDATDRAIKAVKEQRIPGAVNWADLHCLDATIGGEAVLQVTISEVAPEATEFQEAVQSELARQGWPNVKVVTEW